MRDHTLRVSIGLLCMQPLLATAQVNLACAELNTERIELHPYGPRFVTDDEGIRTLDRCEGAFAGQLSGSLSVRTFTAQFEEYRFDATAPLAVSWEAPSLPTSGRVHILAQGVARRVFYRMDSERAITEDSYPWPVDVLEGLRIGRDHLGVLGFTRIVYGEGEQRVHLPLHITQQDQRVQPTSYIVGIWTESRLVQVRMRLAPLARDGTLGEPLAAWIGRDRRNVPIPAERLFSITIPVADLPEPGLYVLRVSVRMADGGHSTEDFHFFHPPPNGN